MFTFELELLDGGVIKTCCIVLSDVGLTALEISTPYVGVATCLTLVLSHRMVHDLS